MSQDEFPHNEYDPTCSQGANCDHMRYMLEGYRAAVLDPDPDTLTCHFSRPYSPRGARDISWTTGFKQALKDLGKLPNEGGTITTVSYGTPGINPVTTEVMHDDNRVAKDLMTAALNASVKPPGDGSPPPDR